MNILRHFRTTLLTLLHSLLVMLLVMATLTACSNTKDSNLANVKEVQQGTVVSVTLTPVKTEPIRPRGGFGVTVGSGGHAGVYGSVDLATIGRILSTPAKPAMMQEIIVRRTNGSLVAITQPEKEPFRRGESIKIVHRGNQARVIH